MQPVRIISPVDGSVYAERMPLAPAAGEAAVARARAAPKGRAALPLADRIARVTAGIARLSDDTPRIVEEPAWQMGRPIRHGGEFGGVNERTAHMATIAAAALAPVVIEDSARFRRLVRREPAGVVLVIAPWNYPHLTAVNPIVPALIAGNAVVLKHASRTLLAGERLAEAPHAGGVPEEVFQNLVLDHATTGALIGARAFGFVNFTGSAAGGAAIERAAAGTFTPPELELGGKDPGLVLEDADLDAAVDGLMDGALYNAGQCCCGIERIYVHEALFEDFVGKAVAWTGQLRLGNPLEAATTPGPMAQPPLAATVRAQVAEALAAGARALIDPRDHPADDGGACLAPQVLVGVEHAMRVMREESFCPVVGIMPFRDEAEAIALMNDSPYGRTASIWTADPGRAEAIGAAVETGTVFMNRCDRLDPALVWTGVKDTGRGGSLGMAGFQSVTRPKSWQPRKVSR